MMEKGFFRIIITLVIALAVTQPACIISADEVPVLTFYTAHALFADSSSARLAGAVADPGAEAYVSGYFLYGTNLNTCPSSTCFTTTPTQVYLFAPPDLFYSDISGLLPDTQYWYRFCVIGGSSGSSYCDGTATFTTLPAPIPPPTPFVVTTSATDVTITGATLNGEVTDMGGASWVDVFFEYGTRENPAWSVGAGTISSAGVFSAGISNLNQGTVYSFKACAHTAAGNVVCGLPLAFMPHAEPGKEIPKPIPTGQPPSSGPPAPMPVVVTHGATDVMGRSATLHGEVTDMGGETSADVYFKYGAPGKLALSVSVDAGTLLGPGTFFAEVSGLGLHTIYSVQACATTTPTGHNICSFPRIVLTQFPGFPETVPVETVPVAT